MTYLRTSMMICLMFTLTFSANAQEWTRFRGPNGTGHHADRSLSFPTNWGEKDYRWKIELKGEGHSSPVLWGEKLFVTSSDRKTGEIFLHCIQSGTGKTLWTKTFKTQLHKLHNFNSFASASAAVDADQVYVTWSNKAQNILVALDHDGAKKWEKDFGPYASKHGSGVSPIVYKDLVILPNDQVGKSWLLALDRKTGNEKWRVPRKGQLAAYSTPCVYPYPGGEWLIFNSHLNGITAINPSDGKVVWEKDDLFDKRSVMSPVIVNDLVIGSCGSGGGGNYVVAVKPGSVDGKTKPTLQWKISRSAPYVPTTLAVGDLLYLYFDGGIISCVDSKTGNVLYRERSKAGTFFGSPVYAGGYIYCISRGGMVSVVKAGKTFEEVGSVDLGEISYATPAIANGQMYLRTSGHLYCLPSHGRKQ